MQSWCYCNILFDLRPNDPTYGARDFYPAFTSLAIRSLALGRRDVVRTALSFPAQVSQFRELGRRWLVLSKVCHSATWWEDEAGLRLS